MNKHMISLVNIYKTGSSIDNIPGEINLCRLLVISHLLNNPR